MRVAAIYADESCLGNGREGENPGGAGGVIEITHPRTGKIVRSDYWLSEPASTNNRMALRSAIEALRLLSVKDKRYAIRFTSDSRYLVDGMTSWVRDWIPRGWRRKGGPIENLVLWQELVELARPHHIHWRWVRGHDGHPQNEYANMLATRAAADQTASKGAVLSRFDEWLSARRARGTRTLEPDPFPRPEELPPTRLLPVDSRASLL
ncbi:MAG TPA: ribonuclease H [Gemmatimonadaceae bacterium]|nr:ribonuclease H [Gemmatimonadaceae bacterium]